MTVVGAIDCGTNSIRLLITRADEQGKLHDLEREMRVVRLGEGVDATGAFSEAALERTFAATREYAELLRLHGVENVRFAATSASRDVSNRDAFVSGIQEILGVTPEVITGVEEANLSFAGAVSAVGQSEKSTVVMDLGGGSTEFVVGNNEGVSGALSLNIGCVRLTERHKVQAPVTAQQRELVEADVRASLETLTRELDFSSVTRIVGVAGTVTTVTAQVLGLTTYDPDAINGSELSIDVVQKAANELAAMNREERLATGFMHPGRADVIGTGAIIWSQALSYLQEQIPGISNVIISEHDILDGIALSLLESGTAR
ncbi:Ppx/GppA phosphatase family protein [Rothia sp. ZJ1223]|uniref:Ppx/GppA phosphatase family protein n=1 Tax=Rothia sp. ZJ1223 TaxID=2811098 RepID=UPI00195A7D22|nr:Ppx/GppA phosphatase family protein [Rothia sp. ZJ1223]MBM7051452.1 Ppx/GppA family phosphatase [Rothia sp. ZJ1223]